jgi:RoxA-like, cytochrome c-like
VQNCARCHGTYGEKWTYPNKVVPLDKIGTDPNLARSFSKEADEYQKASWFGQETDLPGGAPKSVITGGYQAPPLDGVWATAPYFHNGSVPTLYHVLNSKARPKVFTRSFRTGKDDFDTTHIGWKFQLVEKTAPDLTPIEKRKIYDTTQPGRGNAGHTFGDDLTDEERWAVIEYLKSL